MMRKLPLFPLNIVVFPDEKVNLHVFEPRYKQLISDCRETGISFGIPTYLNNTIEYGTEVVLDKVHRIYDDGKMDISVKAHGVIKVIEFENPLEDKLYSGGKVEKRPNIDDGDLLQKENLHNLLIELFDLFVLGDRFDLEDEFNSFTYSHKIGLSVEQEYELLQMPSEAMRLDYLISYLEKSIPVVRQMEEAKQKIQANGHFKHLDPLRF
jgi:hypothetical protein